MEREPELTFMQLRIRGWRLDMSREVRAAVWDKSGGACFYCGKALHPFNDFEVEHQYPVCAGGPNVMSNLVGSCRSCNRKKISQDKRFCANPRFTHDMRVDGAKVRAPRERRMFTVDSLAYRARVSANLIRQIEAGTYGRKCRSMTTFWLAKALGVDEDAIIVPEE